MQSGRIRTQVVSRCRENYKQGRWDEASALLALFEETEWQAMRYLSTSASALLDDKYTRLRKQVVQLLESDADLRAEHALVLPQAVLACLGDALRACLSPANRRQCAFGRAPEKQARRTLQA